MWRATLLALRTALISIPGIAAVTVVAVLAALGAAVVNRRWVETIRRWWAQVLLAVSFVTVRAEGSQRVLSTKPFIICANHMSYMDPVVLLSVLPVSVRFVAKRSLFRIPFLGWGMRIAGDIPLARERARAAASTMALTASIVRQGQSVVFFPEGARSRDGKLQPFHRGAFHVAIQAQVPIVPAAIRGTREALRPGSLLIRGGDVRIRFGEPVVTAGMAKRDHAALAACVEKAIRAML